KANPVGHQSSRALSRFLSWSSSSRRLPAPHEDTETAGDDRSLSLLLVERVEPGAALEFGNDAHLHGSSRSKRAAGVGWGGVTSGSPTVIVMGRPDRLGISLAMHCPDRACSKTAATVSHKKT